MSCLTEVGIVSAIDFEAKISFIEVLGISVLPDTFLCYLMHKLERINLVD